MASTEQTIRSFFVNSVNKDFARDINFRVASLRLGNMVLGEGDLVYCKAAKLPSRSINNVTVKYNSHQFNIPGTHKYDNSESYELEFYCDANSALRKKFEDETRYIFDDATSTGDYLVPRASAVIDLVQLDTKNNAINRYKLVGCSLLSVGEMQYKMAEGTGEVMTFTVKLSYHWYERNDEGPAASLNIGGVSFGL